MNNYKLYLFWMPRTGGTFIWQVLKELMPLKDIWYDHDWIKTDKPVIITYRNPLDMVASQWRIRWGKYNKDKLINVPNQIELNGAIDTIKKQNVIWDKCKDHYQNDKNILWLKYEDFYNNYSYLYYELEKFLNIEIEPNIKREIVRNTNIDKNTKISINIPVNEFGNWDKESRIHAKHIYNRGRPGSWKEIIPEKFHSQLVETFKDDLEKWGYNEEN